MKSPLPIRITPLLVSFLTFLLLSFNSLSQTHLGDSFYFSNLGLKDGLSQLSVMRIYQDTKGYMWFGTRNGLNRYDGNRFTVYKHDNLKNHTISDDQISCLLEDSNQQLWVGTYDGLNRMDLRSEKITSYKSEDKLGLENNYILSLLVDKDKRLLVGTGSGLYVYQPETNRFKRIQWVSKSKNLSINVLVQLKSGQLLIGTRTDGLYVCDRNFKLHTHYSSHSTSPLTGDNITCIFEDNQKQLWVGDYSKGLNQLNLGRGEVKHYTKENGGLSNNSIRSITPLNNSLVLGTMEGLSLLDLKSNRIEKYGSHYGLGNGSLSHPSIYSTYVDKMGTLWVGTYSGGVNYYNSLNNRFRNYDLGNNSNLLFGVFGAMAYQASSNKVWLATEGAGLLEFNPTTKEFNNYLFNKSSSLEHSENVVKSLMIENNTIWCGGLQGKVYQFDLKSKKFNLYYQLPTSGSVYKIYRDLSSNIWICSSSDSIGLYRINPAREVECNFPLRNGTKIHFYNVRSLLELRKNVFLFGTRNTGLILYDANKKSIERYDMTQSGSHHLLSNYITSILRTQKGEIWIGTNGGGVFLFKEGKGIFKQISRSDGLLNDKICDLVESNDHQLWISSINGLSQYNFTTRKVINYDQRNGIDIREFTPHGGLKLPSGDLFFSGSNGFVTFNPHHLPKNPHVPQVVLRSLEINNKLIEPNDSSELLTHTIDCTQSLVLNHSQNNITLSYAALNYIFPEQNQYAYKLVGHDDDWNYVGTRKEAFYTSLKPGKYRFQVIASNNDGKWNKIGKTIEIIVTPPFWATWFAYFIYLVLIVFIVGTILYYINQKKTLEADLHLKNFEQQKLEEFHQAKVRLFTNFSHDLRTPLTLIVTPLEELLRRVDLNVATKSTLQLIYNNSQRLLLLVNQLMDLRKNQSGSMELRVSQQELCYFTEEIYCVFNQIAKSKNIQFSFNHSEETFQAWFDKNLFEKVVFNLLSNAFKFTKDGGLIALEIKSISADEIEEHALKAGQAIDSAASYICLTVSDTGKGISPSEVEHIFTPFYQARHEEEEHIIGTGIGLSLALSIVRLHHGVMWVDSQELKGSAFNVVIPINKEAFSASEWSKVENGEMTQLGVDTQAINNIPLVDDADKPTVLLVEDNHEVRAYVKKQLMPYFQIIESENGADGFDKVLEFFPDIVVTDVMMPKVDGLQLCTLIKNDLNTGHIPVILLTAKSMVMHVKEGYEFGADDYLIKPFNMEVLVIRIRNLLASRKRLKSLYGKRESVDAVSIENCSADDRFTQKFFKVIEDNVSNADMDIDFISKMMGLSRANMYRKLKAITELTPTELVRNKRFEIAAQLFINTEMNVAEVSIETGFNTYEPFSRGFKKVYGLTPTEFIQHRRGKVANS